jgi:hypothetical protein
VVPLFRGQPPASTATVSVAVAAVVVVMVVVVTVAVAPQVCAPFDAAVGAEDSSVEQLNGYTSISWSCSPIYKNIPLRNIFLPGHNTRGNSPSYPTPNQERQYRDSKPK